MLNVGLSSFGDRWAVQLTHSQNRGSGALRASHSLLFPCVLLGSSRQAVNNAYSTLAVEKAIDRAKKADSTKLTAVELKEIIQPSFASVHEPSDMIFYKLHMLFPFRHIVWCTEVKYRFWFSSFFL